MISTAVRLLLLGWLGALAASTPGAASTPPAPAATARPNFLIVLADDMGFADAGSYGGETATPNLDRLAANGLRYTQFYSTARCWPSRSCLLTGYYAQQVRMDPPKDRLPGWTRVLPHYLKPLGYRTYHSGKWHLMGAPKPCADGGFDHSYCIEDHNRYFAPRDATLDDRKLPAIPEGSPFYLTTEIADRAIGFLREHATNAPTQPFLLYLAFTAPHFPLHAPPDDIARYASTFQDGWDAIRGRRWQRQQSLGLLTTTPAPADPITVPPWNLGERELVERLGPGEVGRAVRWDDLPPAQQRFQAVKMAIHAAMIDRLDRELGRVLDQLRAMGVYSNTVVTFASDNGASAEQIIRGDGHDPAAPAGSGRTFLCLGPGWATAANTPFRLYKSWVHEGGISSPLIIQWLDGIKARGAIRHTPGHFIDLLPTLPELAGPVDGNVGRPTGAPPLPGRSLVRSFASDRRIERDFLYWHHLNHRALRVGDWKIVSAGTADQEGPWELYDLGRDRTELKDLAARDPDRLGRMTNEWQRLERQFRAEAGTAAR